MSNAEEMSHQQAIENLSSTEEISMGQVIEKWAHVNGKKPAILYEAESISYTELNERANQYANYFLQLGFAKGDVVALLMNNHPEYISILIGLSKIGVIPALIHTGIRGEVLVHDINLCEARAVIAGREMLEVLTSIQPRLRLRMPATFYIQTYGQEAPLPDNMTDIYPLIAQSSSENPDPSPPVTSSNILAYLFTAGHSGPRKAVPIQHKRWLYVGYHSCMDLNVEEDSVFYISLPLYYNSGFNAAGTVFTAGAALALRSQFSVQQFWDDIRRYHADYFMAVGEMCRYLLQQPEQAGDQEHGVKYAITNGLKPDLAASFGQRFAIPHLVEVYGITEGIGYFINQEEIPGMCGKLTLDGQRQGEVVRYDSKQETMLRTENGYLIPCTPGETGLLVLKITEFNEFYGYLNDPEATKSSIIQNAFQAGDQYFNTLDLVQLHAGDHISFVDQLGDTYRWKGITVSASQVADVIDKFFGGIEDTAVYGVSIPGREGRCGMAAIQIIPGETLKWKAFLKHLNRRMPEHARPVFIRLHPQLDFSQGLMPLLHQLKKEGYDPRQVKDPLYYLDPQANRYLRLTPERYQDIIEGRIIL